MEVSEDYIERIVEHAMERAKVHREKVGFKGSFLPVAIVVGPQGEQAPLPIPFRSEDEKAIMMKSLTTAARDSNAAAVVLVVDSVLVYGPHSTDALKVTAKGPFIKSRQRFTPYRESVGDSIVFTETENYDDAPLLLPFLPDDWWDTALPN
jgi:hypothetical protein